MLYYTLGLIVSVMIFGFLLAILRTPINNPYEWTLVFSLDFLSAASVLIFASGLFIRAVQEFRLRDPSHTQTHAQQMPPRLPPPMPQRPRQSEFGRRGVQRRAATYEEIQQAYRHNREQVTHRLKGSGNIEEEE